MPWVSSVEGVASPKQENIKVDMLVQTSKKGWHQVEDYSVDPNRKFEILDKDRNNFGTMALVSGQFKSFFEGKPIPKAFQKDEKGKPKEIKDSTKGRVTKKEMDKPGRFIVIGDSDFIGDDIAKNLPQNLALFLNAVDYLTLDEDLISIRSKTIAERPLKEMSENGKLAVKTIAVLAGPIIFMAYGLFRLMMRRRLMRRNEI